MIKIFSTLILYIMVFIRSWLPLLICLALHETIHIAVERFITQKKTTYKGYFSIYGIFFYPLMSFSVQILSGMSLILGWTRPQYHKDKDITFGKRTLIAVSGPIANLLFALMLSYLSFHVWNIDKPVESNIVLWALEPWILLLIKLNLIIFLVNLLPIYPFDASKLIAPYLFKTDTQMFSFKITSLIAISVLFLMPSTWAFIDKIISAFVSLFY